MFAELPGYEFRVFVPVDLIDVQACRGGEEGSAGVVEQFLHFGLIASAEYEHHILHSLHGSSEQSFGVFFGVVEYLLEFINGDAGLL